MSGEVTSTELMRQRIVMLVVSAAVGGFVWGLLVGWWIWA